MKKLLTILFIIVLSNSFGQNAKTYRQMVEINNVPKNVKTEFNLRYPKSFVKMWYITNITYWYEDYGPANYNNWYKQRTVVVYRFDQPSYYEVEFLNQDENSRAVFNRYGTWFETRTQVQQLPEKIKKALKNSEYGAWKWSDYKEKIEAPGMQGPIYRMAVFFNNMSNIIRINENGDIVQIKTE